jgi:hypothetical protein
LEKIMKKWFGPFVLTALLFLVPSIHAQAVYTASKTPLLEVGAGFLYLNNDYTPQSDQGITAWVDANLNRFIGLEAEGHFGVIQSPSDYGENSFLIGPRFSVHRGKASLYAKAMVGRGEFVHDLPYHYSSTGYTAYAFGGGLEYRVFSSWKLRLVDAEFQTWPSFPPNGLTPYAISTGVMYIFH